MPKQRHSMLILTTPLYVFTVSLGAVQKLGQPKEGEGGVYKKMISDDPGGGGGSTKDDG